MRENKGITLIALVVTIVILIILASVTLSMVLSNNGILNMAIDASKKTKLASEKEAIEFIISDIKTDLMIGEEIPNEKYIGDKLSEMSVVTGDWKNVIVGENTYKDGWYLVEKGEEITGYGEAKLNWLINYDTGKIIELKDGEYTVANANASGAIVDETLKLNIDPVNLQDPSKWGEGISFIGGNPQDAVTKSELKFDGIDDYLKIENVNVENSEGMTFEFYGKSDGSMYFPLSKTYFNGDEISLEGSYFSAFRFKRFEEETDTLNCCFNVGVSGSDKIWHNLKHWISFDLPKNPEFEYYSLSVVMPDNTDEKVYIKLYQNGKKIDETTCDYNYIINGDITNDKLPFTIGLAVSQKPDHSGCWAEYSKFDLYSCRLYTRVLTDGEIAQNYTATTEYHTLMETTH